MQIRNAKSEDLHELQQLNTKIMYRNSEYDPDIVDDFMETTAGEKYMKKALANKKGCFYIAEDNGKMVGYVNGQGMDISYRKSKYFELENLGVIPEYKRSGIGKQLLDRAYEWAKQHGFEKIYLICYAKNEEALTFYRKHGMKDIDICLEMEI